MRRAFITGVLLLLTHRLSAQIYNDRSNLDCVYVDEWVELLDTMPSGLHSVAAAVVEAPRPSTPTRFSTPTRPRPDNDYRPFEQLDTLPPQIEQQNAAAARTKYSGYAQLDQVEPVPTTRSDYNDADVYIAPTTTKPITMPSPSIVVVPQTKYAEFELLDDLFRPLHEATPSAELTGSHYNNKYNEYEVIDGLNKFIAPAAQYTQQIVTPRTPVEQPIATTLESSYTNAFYPNIQDFEPITPEPVAAAQATYNQQTMKPTPAAYAPTDLEYDLPAYIALEPVVSDTDPSRTVLYEPLVPAIEDTTAAAYPTTTTAKTVVYVEKLKEDGFAWKPEAVLTQPASWPPSLTSAINDSFDMQQPTYTQPPPVRITAPPPTTTRRPPPPPPAVPRKPMTSPAFVAPYAPVDDLFLAQTVQREIEKVKEQVADKEIELETVEIDYPRNDMVYDEFALGSFAAAEAPQLILRPHVVVDDMFGSANARSRVKRSGNPSAQPKLYPVRRLQCTARRRTPTNQIVDEMVVAPMSAEHAAREAIARCIGKPTNALVSLGNCKRSYFRCGLDNTLLFCVRPSDVFSEAAGGCTPRSRVAECARGSPIRAQQISASSIARVPSKNDTAAVNTTMSAPVDCETKADGFYRHHEDCSRFVQCFNGEQFEYPPCPKGLVYNEKRERCDHRHMVEDCQPPADVQRLILALNA